MRLPGSAALIGTSCDGAGRRPPPRRRRHPPRRAETLARAPCVAVARGVVPIEAAVAEAEARAARNGLTLETYDGDFGDPWPGVRFAGAQLMRGREVIGWAACSYRDEASRKVALLSSLERVYFRP